MRRPNVRTQLGSQASLCASVHSPGPSALAHVDPEPDWLSTLFELGTRLPPDRERQEQRGEDRNED